jgi:hypothetical protein
MQYIEGNTRMLSRYEEVTPFKWLSHSQFKITQFFFLMMEHQLFLYMHRQYFCKKSYYSFTFATL